MIGKNIGFNNIQNTDITIYKTYVVQDVHWDILQSNCIFWAEKLFSQA